MVSVDCQTSTLCFFPEWWVEYFCLISSRWISVSSLRWQITVNNRWNTRSENVDELFVHFLTCHRFTSLFRIVTGRGIISVCLEWKLWPCSQIATGQQWGSCLPTQVVFTLPLYQFSWDGNIKCGELLPTTGRRLTLRTHISIPSVGEKTSLPPITPSLAFPPTVQARHQHS